MKVIFICSPTALTDSVWRCEGFYVPVLIAQLISLHFKGTCAFPKSTHFFHTVENKIIKSLRKCQDILYGNNAYKKKYVEHYRRGGFNLMALTLPRNTSYYMYFFLILSLILLVGHLYLNCYVKMIFLLDTFDVFNHVF